MAEGTSPFGFELDDRHPLLFHHPQERKIVLKRPDDCPLILTVVLSYVDGVFCAAIKGAAIDRDDRGKGGLGMPTEKWMAVNQMVRDFYGAQPFPPPDASESSQS